MKEKVDIKDAVHTLKKMVTEKEVEMKEQGFQTLTHALLSKNICHLLLILGTGKWEWALLGRL